MRGRGAYPEAVCCNMLMCALQGSFPVRKRTGTLRIWRAREREPIWGSGGGAPSGVQGQSPWLRHFTADESKFVTHLSET